MPHCWFIKTGKILMEYLFRNKEEASKNSKPTAKAVV